MKSLFVATSALLSEPMLEGNALQVTNLDELRAYTIGAAYFSQEEGWRGSIEPGKVADLAVLSDNPLTVPIARMEEITSLLTLVNGKVVHHAPGW